MSAEIRWITACLDTEAEDAPAVESFWAQVTGYRLSERWGARAELASLVPPDGDPHLAMRTVEAPSPGGLHLQLHTDDVEGLVARAERVGGTARPEEGRVVAGSPAGLSFSVVGDRASRSATPVAWPGGRSKVDQVSIDVPPSRWEEECRFWAELTGWALVDRGMSAEYRRLRRPAGLAIQLLLQRLDTEPQDGATAHLDLGSDDYLAETDRHLTLGAQEVRRTEHWVTLLDPSGRAYCVTRHSVDRPAA